MINTIVRPSDPTSLRIQAIARLGPAVKARRASGSSLQQPGSLSNSISSLDPSLRKLVDVVTARAPRKGSLRSALIRYLVADQTLVEIARENSVTIPSIMYWAEKLRLPGRKRGRRALQAPTPEQRQMIRLFSAYGAGEAARRSGKSRQRIYQVVERWAPELMMQPRLRRMRHLPPSGHRARRRVVIGFRITDDELRELQSVAPPSGEHSLSANGRARDIVLDYISPRTSTASATTRPSSSQPSKTTATASSGPHLGKTV